ncbi:MAG: adenylate/guanylate cyclase domain-containing protein, partial [Bacteroidota bacterium]
FYLYEISGYLGRTVINNFFTGRYHQPRQEERIFMFLDMKDSTQIAEQLGHIQYFRLLNQYFADLSDAILNTSGAVYQYAGDEIIVTWDLPTGTRNNNCIRCFFMIKEILHSLSGEYEKAFGLVPQFKAGFHQGEVTTGEIGVLKKEIFFTGDVINTAARIQSLCNNMGKTILVSEDLISRLDLSGEFAVFEMGEQELKGKQSKVKLFTLEPLDP